MYNWTVIFLVKCDDESAQVASAKAMFEEILACKISTDVAVIFCLRMPVSLIRSLDAAYSPAPGTDPDGLTTVFYKTIPLSSTVGGRNSQLVQLGIDEPQFDITDKVDIQRYFRDKVLGAGYAGKKHLLFTWGHGAAAGIYFTRSFPPPGEKIPILTMEDLKTAITGAFGNNDDQKINVMIMMNCFMQYFDALFALRAARVDYLMTSQFGLDFVGYNYTAIFTILYASSATLQSRDLANLTITSLKTAAQRSKLATGAFFASDLSVCDQLAPAISLLGEQLSYELTQRPDKIVSIIKGRKYIHTDYDLVDIFLVARALKRKLRNSLAIPTIDKILDLRDQLLTARYFGLILLTLRPRFTRGASICLPLDKNGHFFLTFVDPGSTRASLFSRSYDSKWSNFVVSYSQRLP